MNANFSAHPHHIQQTPGFYGIQSVWISSPRHATRPSFPARLLVIASKGVHSKIARHIFKEVGVRSELYEKEKTPGLLGFTMWFQKIIPSYSISPLWEWLRFRLCLLGGIWKIAHPLGTLPKPANPTVHRPHGWFVHNLDRALRRLFQGISLIVSIRPFRTLATKVTTTHSRGGSLENG